MPRHTPSALLSLAASGALLLSACKDDIEEYQSDWEVIGEYSGWFTGPTMHDGAPVVLSSEGLHDLSAPEEAPIPVDGLTEHDNSVIRSAGPDRLYVYSALYFTGPNTTSSSSLIDTSTNPATVLWTTEPENDEGSGMFWGIVGDDPLYSIDGEGLALLNAETGEETIFGEGFYQFGLCSTSAAGACCVGEESQSEVLVIEPGNIEIRQSDAENAISCMLHPSGEVSILATSETDNALVAIRQDPSDAVLWTERFTSEEGSWSSGEISTSSSDDVLFVVSDSFTRTVEMTPDGAELLDGSHHFMEDGYRFYQDTEEGGIVFTSPQGDTTRAEMIGTYLPSMLKHEDRVYGHAISSYQDTGFCGLLCAIVNNQQFGTVVTNETYESANITSTFTLP